MMVTEDSCYFSSIEHNTSCDSLNPKFPKPDILKIKKRYIELTLFATKFHKHLLSNSFTDSGLMQKIVPLWF